MNVPALGSRRSLPRIIAHRGASSTHPENTVSAFDAAMAEGCDGIELDLQLSRDGIPVVYHDRTLRKIGGGARTVHQTRWAEIAQLDAGSWLDPHYAGQRAPSLDEVLDRYARRTWLLIELKVRPRDKQVAAHLALADALGQRLRRRRLTRRVMVLSFDIDTLQRVSTLTAQIPTVLNLRAPRRVTQSFRRMIDRVSALSVDVRTISSGVVAAVHEAGKPVLTYTCNTQHTVRRALRAGVDGVMTDRPGWLSQMLQTTERLPPGWR